MGCGRGANEPAAQPSAASAPSPFQVAISSGTSPRPKSEPPRRAASGPFFRDVHKEAKLEHVYVNGERGRCLMFETTGGGAGWLDYDGDGHWDLYLNQGGDLTVDADATQPLDKLFRNRGDGTFEDVTAMARIVEFRYGQGVAVGDYDNDGFDDIYVTNVGGNTLFHNQGDGTFLEVTGQAGVRDGRWSTSAAWADLDLDGNLDLYVCNYCAYDPKNPLECRNLKGQPSICHPRNIPPSPDECYINVGDGTFSAEARKRGLVDESGRGMGVAVADFNNDGLPDVFVANDTTANFLFVNQGGGMFQEKGLVLGCAADGNGAFMANMGAAAYDIDNNGWLDIYVTHFHNESDTLYRNYGLQGFQDETLRMGLHTATVNRLSFGVVMADFNQDGLPEVVLACGHIENSPGYPFYRMAPQCLAFDGRQFRECSKEAGEYFAGKRVGRAIAACDYDEDGALDLVVVHENSPAALLHNESQRGHWLKFFLRGRESNRRGIGSRITVKAGPTTYMQELCGGTSYCATHQPSLILGLGDRELPCTVTVRWPSGRVQTLENVRVDRTLLLDESQAHRDGAKTPLKTAASDGRGR